jgi:hypothetical protein
VIRKLTPLELHQAVAGDGRALATVERSSPEEIRDCRSHLSSLELTAAQVRAVLTSLLEGGIQPETAQRWASFVLRGYVGDSAGSPRHPIQIDYEPGAEQQIVDALARLDEIGDRVDGHVGADDLRALIGSLATSDC